MGAKVQSGFLHTVGDVLQALGAGIVGRWGVLIRAVAAIGEQAQGVVERAGAGAMDEEEEEGKEDWEEKEETKNEEEEKDAPPRKWFHYFPTCGT